VCVLRVRGRSTYSRLAELLLDALLLGVVQKCPKSARVGVVQKLQQEPGVACAIARACAVVSTFTFLNPRRKRMWEGSSSPFVVFEGERGLAEHLPNALHPLHKDRRSLPICTHTTEQLINKLINYNKL
jgi:hypothetical protein